MDNSRPENLPLAPLGNDQPFKDLFETSGVVILIVDPESGSIIDANPAAVGFYGYTRKQLSEININHINQLPPEIIKTEMQRAKNNHKNYFVFPHRLADGTIRTVEVYSNAVNTEGHKLLYSFIHDITDQQQSKEALQLERQRLASIIRGTHVGTWEWHVQMGEVVFNERWAEIIGYTLEELAPVSIETWAKFTHPDDLKTSNELLQRHFSGELDYYECDCRMQHKDGRWIWVMDRGSVTEWDTDGRPVLMSGTHTDINERKQAEMELASTARQRRMALDAACMGMWHFNPDTLIFTLDAPGQAIMGIKSGESPVSEVLDKIVRPEDLLWLRRKMDASIGSSEPAPFQAWGLFKLPGDVLRWVEAYGIAAFEGEGKGRRLARWDGTVFDITARKQSEEALRQSEAQHRMILQLAMDGFWRSDLQGNLLEINEAYCKMSGYTREELLGENISRLIAAESHEKTIEHIKAIIEHGSDRFEGRQRRKDGNVFDVEINAQYMPELGQYLVIFIKDITERKQAEKSLAVQRDLAVTLSSVNDLPAALNSILQAILEIGEIDSGGIYLVDPDDGHMDLVVQTGLSPEFVASAAYFAADSPNTRLVKAGAPIYQPYTELAARTHAGSIRMKEGLRTGAMIPITSDGKVVSALNLASRTHDDISASTRTLVEVMATQVGGVVSRLRASATLAGETSRRKALFDQAPTGIVTIDMATLGILEFNELACKQLGYSREEFSRLRIPDIEAIETADDTKATITKTINTGRNEFDTRQRTKKGEIRDVHVIAHYYQLDGRHTYQCIWQDITELKTIQTRLEHSFHIEHELRQKLENEIRGKEEFNRALVHELKTPLTPIMNSSEMLLGILKPGIPLRLAKNVFDAANDLNHRVEELLDLAKMEVGTFRMNLRPSKIITIIEDIVHIMRPMALKNNQVINAHLPASLPLARIDPERLRQVLMNLVTNSIKYCPKGAKIAISARTQEGDLIVEVEDNGPGISEEMQKRLFNPYFRADNQEENMSGMGLGLVISKKIIELHGGHIWFKSQLGKGSICGFSIRLQPLE